MTGIKVLGGDLSGRKIYCKNRIKSTTSRVVKSLFDIIGNKIRGSIFLDCFGGSARISIEAYSRGAKLSIIVEKDIKFYKEIVKNIQTLNIKKIYTFNTDIITFIDEYSLLKKKKQIYEDFDFIFIDPPYQDIWIYPILLKKIEKNNILSDNGMIILEHTKRYSIEPNLTKYNIDNRSYGDSILTFLRKKSGATAKN